MKYIRILLWIVVVWSVWYGVYKISTIFSDSTVVIPVQALQNKMQDAKSYSDNIVKNGLQYAESWAQNLLASGQKLLDQKKIEAEQYLIQQKEQLKADAQKRLEEEAKKQIQALFTGK